MKEKIAYILWFCLYALCVGLGTIENPQGFGKILLILIALLFFAPGSYLLYLGHRQNRAVLIRLRWVALISLSLTLCMLVINLFSVLFSTRAGDILYEVLILVSAPMFCSQYWIISLFLWACLLFGTWIKFPHSAK